MTANDNLRTGGAGFRSYRITSPSHEVLVILAVSIADALDVALQFHTLHGVSAVKFTIDPGWASTLSGAGRDHLEEARQFCTEPSILSRYRADSGWALGSPELGVEDW